MVNQLDDAQKLLLFELCFNSRVQRKNVLIVAPAGKGKSFFLLLLRHILVQQSGYDAVLMTSMLKANALKINGSTFSSALCLPIGNV